MARAPKFSMSEFENWFSKQNDAKKFFTSKQESIDPLSKFIGQEVRPRVSRRKLLEKIESTHPDEYALIEDFLKNGGEITDVNGKNLCIEVSEGDFELPRFCVKILQDD